MKNKIIILSILALSCGGKKDQKTAAPDDRLSDLKVKFDEQQLKAKDLRDPITGWLSVSDCDAMIWAGKYACSMGEAKEVNLRASEYPDQPGRFDRRPPPFCWTKELGDQGSKTTWSRDMGIAGLLPGAWCQRDLSILMDHAAYGEAHSWDMGEPVADGRGIYTPPLIGSLYAVIKALGGPTSGQEKIPAIYLPGLKDYEAHLQMMDIWLRGELKDSVSQVMLDRIREHASREPSCPFYVYMKGLYSGSQAKTVDLLLSSDTPDCSYARSNEEERTDLAEWLFVARMTIKELEPTL